MFRGAAHRPKGRLSVPARFREAPAQLGENSDQWRLFPNEHALEVHPLAEWQRIEAKVNAQPMFTRRCASLPPVHVAGQGHHPRQRRVLLLPDTRKDAGLDKEVTLGRA